MRTNPLDAAIARARSTGARYVGKPYGRDPTWVLADEMCEEWQGFGYEVTPTAVYRLSPIGTGRLRNAWAKDPYRELMRDG